MIYNWVTDPINPEQTQQIHIPTIIHEIIGDISQVNIKSIVQQHIIDNCEQEPPDAENIPSVKPCFHKMMQHTIIIIIKETPT
jgi:hypothetical protein